MGMINNAFRSAMAMAGPFLGLNAAAHLGLGIGGGTTPPPAPPRDTSNRMNIGGIGLEDNRNALLAMARASGVKESDNLPAQWMSKCWPKIYQGLGASKGLRLQMIIGYDSDIETSVEELKKVKKTTEADGTKTETPQTVERKRRDNVIGRMILCYIAKEVGNGTDGDTSPVVELLKTILVEPQDVAKESAKAAASEMKTAFDSTVLIEAAARIWLSAKDIKAIKAGVMVDTAIADADKNDAIGSAINAAIAKKLLR